MKMVCFAFAFLFTMNTLYCKMKIIAVRKCDCESLLKEIMS